MTKLNVPHSVEIIINELEKNGFEAFAVGGCVRDAILNKTPNDWDITTSAMPEDVKGIFNKTFDTGIKHGTITVLIDHVGYEVTTYRIDGEYLDGRHPESVEFTSNLSEDLKRRDFTINAMAYSHRTGIVDTADGMGDLERRVIKCVGNPIDRFNEDALRILRAIRFASTLNFEIEENTNDAIIMLADNLRLISKERIQAELEKLVMSDYPEKLIIGYDCGVTRVIFNVADTLASNNKLETTLNFVKACEKDHYVRWAALLSSLDSEGAKQMLKELKFDNKTINFVSRLVMAIKADLPTTRSEIRKSIHNIGEDVYARYVSLMRIYANFHSLLKLNPSSNITVDAINKLELEYTDILNKGECLSLKTLAINGRDLMELGAERGSMVGEILNTLLEKVLENSELNTRDSLISLAKEFL